MAKLLSVPAAHLDGHVAIFELMNSFCAHSVHCLICAQTIAP